MIETQDKQPSTHITSKQHSASKRRTSNRFSIPWTSSNDKHQTTTKDSDDNDPPDKQHNTSSTPTTQRNGTGSRYSSLKSLLRTNRPTPRDLPSARTPAHTPTSERMASTPQLLISGTAYKWTGYYGKWKLRYFELVPGVLQYGDADGSCVKNIVPLRYCHIRPRPASERELELADSKRTIIIKFKDKGERQIWAKALVASQLKTTDLSGRASPPASVQPTPTFEPFATQNAPIVSSSQIDYTFEDREEPYSESEAGEIPLVKLQRELMSHEQEIEVVYEEVDRLETRFIQTLALLKDAGLGDKLKEIALELIQQMDSLQGSVKHHLRTTQTLVDEEKVERQTLQSSLRKSLRDNYKLGLRLERATRLGGSLRRGGDCSGGGSKHVRRQTIPKGDFQLPAAEVSEDVFFDATEAEHGGGKMGIRRGSLRELIASPMSSTQIKQASETDLSSSASSSSAYSLAVDKEDEGDDEGGQSLRTSAIVQTPLVVANRNSLGLPPVDDHQYRTKLPVPVTEMKISLWSLLKDCVGKDLTRIALPVYFNEPTSFLQRLTEDYQYSYLLERAALKQDPLERLLLVSIFTTTPFASAVGRTYKPFNPLLGETFEFCHRGYRFQAEQIGHHPPTIAHHTDGKNFSVWGHATLATKFTGKSLEAALLGPTNYRLCLPKDDGPPTYERYTYIRPRTIVNNILFGKISVDVAGLYTVTNHTTGDYAVVEFPRKGWWSSELHPVRGAVFDCQGLCHWRFSGIWSKGIECQKLNRYIAPRGTPNENTIERSPRSAEIAFAAKEVDFQIDWTAVVESSMEEPVVAWTPDARPPSCDQFYDFGFMTFELNEISPYYDRDLGAPLPHTDSRLRPDQRALERGEVELSNREKVRLEEKQRAAARVRGSESLYKPRWYTLAADDITGDNVWTFDKRYWRARDENWRLSDCEEHFGLSMNIF